ncbi:hypothetical protein [Streptomyces sp. C36]|uniref:hypothetical protein n=1 Tax=Streptomyces sp. C36 TaxID=3237122 RepID=UPI0034C686D5
MKITIEGASEEFAEKLVALAAQHRAELTVIDTAWTVERAERYIRSLPAGARHFAQIVVMDNDGYADADTLRQALGKLNGPTVALSRAIPRGVREGWWPEGTRAPISAVYDPENPSWHKNIAYKMDRENVPVFRAAFTRLDRAPARLNWGDEDVPSGLEVAPGWGADDDVPRVMLTSPEEDGR